MLNTPTNKIFLGIYLKRKIYIRLDTTDKLKITLRSFY